MNATSKWVSTKNTKLISFWIFIWYNNLYFSNTIYVSRTIFKSSCGGMTPLNPSFPFKKYRCKIPQVVVSVFPLISTESFQNHMGSAADLNSWWFPVRFHVRCNVDMVSPNKHYRDIFTPDRIMLWSRPRPKKGVDRNDWKVILIFDINGCKSVSSKSRRSKLWN